MLPSDHFPLSGFNAAHHSQDSQISQHQQELDQVSNEFLKDQKAQAAQKIEKGVSDQSEVNALFTIHREGLKEVLITRFVPGKLSEKEVDSYLDDFASAWQEKYRVEPQPLHATASPMQLFGQKPVAPSAPKLGGAAVDPAVQHAQEDATAWLQSLPANFNNPALVGFIQAFLAAANGATTLQDLQTWFSQNIANVAAILFNSANGGIQISDINRIAQDCEEAIPSYTPMEQMVSQAGYWAVVMGNTDPYGGRPVALLLYDTIIAYQFDAQGPADVASWAQGIADGGFQGYTISVSESLTFLQISGASPSLPWAQWAATNWQQNDAPGSVGYNLATQLLNEVNNLINGGGSYQNLQSWFQALAINPAQDIYMQFPGLSQTDATFLFQICSLQTAPPPTTLDTEYAAIIAWISANPNASAADRAFMQSIATEMASCGSQGSAAFNQWFTTNYNPIPAPDGFNDIYMQNPAVEETTIQALFNALGIHYPVYTANDESYTAAYNWLQDHQAPAGDASLFNDLLAQIRAVGSNGNYGIVEAWAQNIIQHSFSEYPGVTAATQTEFQNITGALPALTYALAQAQQWRNGLQPNSPDYALATALISEIQALQGAGGTITDLQNYFAQQFSSTDIYMTYSLASLGAISQFYSISFLQSPPAITFLDTVLRSAQEWLVNNNPAAGSEDRALMESLVNEALTLTSSGSQAALSAWFNNQFPPGALHDIYMEYPEASNSAITAFYAIAQEGSAPAVTANDQRYQAAYVWLHQAPPLPGIDAQLFTALLDQIYAVGSSGNFAPVAAWAAGIVSNDYLPTYGAVTLASQTQFQNIAGTQTPLQYAMEKALQWKNSLPAGSADLALANALIAQIQAIENGQGTMASLQNYFAQLFATNDIYMQYPQTSDAGIAEFYSIIEMGGVPAPTALDTVARNTALWLINTNPLSDADRTLLSSLLTEVQRLGSQGTQAQLNSWFQGQYGAGLARDIYMQAPGTSQNAIDALYNYAGQGAPPAETTLDGKYRAAYVFLYSNPPPSAQDALLINALLAEIGNLGSAGSSAALTTWAQGIVEDGFSQYPGISAGGLQTFYQITGAVTAIAYALSAAENWLHSLPSGSPDIALANELIAEIQSLGSQGTMAQLQQQVQTLFATQDIYMSYPLASNAGISQFYAICQITNVPAMTYMDGIAREVVETLEGMQPGSPDSDLIKTLLAGVMAQGSSGSQADLDAWFAGQYPAGAHEDVYMQNPSVSQSAINTLYSLAHQGAPPAITALDEKYQAVYAFLHTNPPPSAQDVLLMNAVLAEIASLGSAGSPVALTTWAQGIVEDGFSQYPGISAAGLQTFYQITGAVTAIAYALSAAESWLHSLPSGSPDIALANELIAEIQSLGSQGTMAQLQQQVQTLFATQDIYMSYLFASNAAVGQFYTICQIRNIPQVTYMDGIAREVAETIAGMVPGSPDSALIQALLAGVTAQGSAGSQADLNAWFNSHYPPGAHDDIYMQYPNVSQNAINALYALAQQGSPPAITVLDEKYQAVYAFLHTTPPPSAQDALLMNAVLAEIASLGSAGSPVALTTWAQGIVEDGFSQYPGISAAGLQTFYGITGAVTAIAYALSAAQNWLHSLPAGSPDIALANALIAEIQGLGPQGTIAELQQQVQTLFAIHDIYMSYLFVSNAAVGQFYTICQIRNIPQITYMDGLARNTAMAAAGMIPNSPDWNLIQGLLSGMITQGSAGSQATLDAWFNAHYPPGALDDIYMQAPTASQNAINELYSLAYQGAPPAETVLDSKYRAIYAFLHTNPLPSPQDAQLLGAVLTQIAELGSMGSPNNLIVWAQNIVEDGFSAYPGISAEGLQAFYAVTGAITAIAYALEQAQVWLQSLPPGSSDIPLANELIAEIQALGPQGTIAQLQNNLRALFAVQDIYMSYPFASAAAAAQLYAICQLGAPPPITTMDTVFRETAAWLFANNPAPNSPDYMLLNALLNEAGNLGSAGSQAQLNAWFNAQYPPGAAQDIYMRNPDASQGAINALYTFAGQGGPPAQTSMDAKYKLAYDWLHQIPPLSGPNSILAQALVAEIFTTLGSAGSLNALLSWGQTIVDGGFAGFPGISQTAETTFCQITGAIPPQDPYINIKKEIAAYLQQREADLAGLLALLNLPYPQGQEQWDRLIQLAKGFYQKLSFAMQNCHSSGEWLSLGAMFNFSGNAAQIQQEAAARLALYAGAAGDRSAISLFTNVLTEITTLENSHAPYADLIAWAQNLQPQLASLYPDLSAADIAEFNQLFQPS